MNCYSALAINETSPAIEDPGFMTRGAERYAIRAGSPLSDKGADYAAAGGASAFDLSGAQRRKIGSRVDIGCFEANAAGLILVVK